MIQSESPAAQDELLYLREGAGVRVFLMSMMDVFMLVGVFVFVGMVMLVGLVVVSMLVRMGMGVGISSRVGVRGRDARSGSRDGCPTMAMLMFVVVVVFQVDIKLGGLQCRSAAGGRREGDNLPTQFLQLVLKLGEIDAQVDQRAEKHVAADAAENVEVNGFH